MLALAPVSHSEVSHAQTFQRNPAGKETVPHSLTHSPLPPTGHSASESVWDIYNIYVCVYEVKFCMLHWFRPYGVERERAVAGGGGGVWLGTHAPRSEDTTPVWNYTFSYVRVCEIQDICHLSTVRLETFLVQERNSWDLAIIIIIITINERPITNALNNH